MRKTNILSLFPSLIIFIFGLIYGLYENNVKTIFICLGMIIGVLNCILILSVRGEVI
jgi:hypothetical protein